MDARERQLRQWLAGILQDSEISLEAASSDASFRRYFRIHFPDDKDRESLVVMDAPPEKEPVAPFVDVAQRLSGAGLHVPRILAEDREAGFLLLSDLGRQTYLEAFAEQDSDSLLEAALEALIRMQMHADPLGLPDYDRALLERELALFPEWYLRAECGISLSSKQQRHLDELFEAIVGRSLAQASVFVHRDYMPRNLMLSQPLPGVLDFQDAVRGPISYDPVCLFMDAFVSWPPQEVTAWLRHYHQRALAAGLPVPESEARFLSDCRWMATQRHLKVIGIFARICHRDGKPRYLADVPRFFSYLRDSAAAEPELGEGLERLFDSLPGHVAEPAS